MPGSSKDELGGIQEDIENIPLQKPHLRKWFVGTPATEAKKRKVKASKERKTQHAHKAAASEISSRNGLLLAGVVVGDNAVDESGQGTVCVEEPASFGDAEAAESLDELAESDSDVDPQNDAKPSKKQKLEAQPDVLPDITTYIDVITPARTLKLKPTSTPRGPFFFTTATTHLEFLQQIATCVVEGRNLATISAISQKDLSWKLNIPANDKKKPLANEHGYQALIKKMVELSNKQKDCTITVSLPPLARVARNPTDIAAGSFGSDVDDEEFQEGPMGATIREQKAAINRGNNGYVELLRQRYPLGGDARYPNKRVYSSEGRSWELNDIRMQIWAHHLAANPPTATLDSPPASAHFSESQKLRNPPAEKATPESVGPPAVAMAPPYMPFGYPPFQPPYPYPQYGYPHYPPFHPVPAAGPDPYNPPPPFPPRAMLPSRFEDPASAPPSPFKIVLPRPVTLAEFCERYEIDSDDQNGLAKLKFQPGDRRVNNLERVDWQDYAGFSKLSWDDFLEKHKVFIRDVKAGCWA